MRTFKENFALNRKSKSGRERFITELGDTRKAMLVTEKQEKYCIFNNFFFFFREIQKNLDNIYKTK